MNILAYVDPGAGQLLWQTLAAACVGSLYYVYKVIRYFRRK